MQISVCKGEYPTIKMDGNPPIIKGCIPELLYWIEGAFFASTHPKVFKEKALYRNITFVDKCQKRRSISGDPSQTSQDKCTSYAQALEYKAPFYKKKRDITHFQKQSSYLPCLSSVSKDIR